MVPIAVETNRKTCPPRTVLKSGCHFQYEFDHDRILLTGKATLARCFPIDMEPKKYGYANANEAAVETPQRHSFPSNQEQNTRLNKNSLAEYLLSPNERTPFPSP